MSWWQALILGIVEGVTEYVPISSTGHLILVAWLLGLADDPERWSAVFTFNIVIQAGAIAAVMILYRQRLREMAAGLAGRDEDGRRLALHVAVAFVPSGIVGLLLSLSKDVQAWLNHPTPVAWALFAGAFLMLAVGRHHHAREAGVGIDLEAMNVRMALYIGCGQCLAMWPGTSRSMMTIVVAILLGLRAAAAAEFSFLLGLVTLSAATGYKLVFGGTEMFAEFGVAPVAVGFVAATVAAAVAVKWFVMFLNRHGLAPFAWYRLALALLFAGGLVVGWIEVPAG